MNIVSYNVRGLGGAVKRRKLKELIRQHQVEFIAIQETKLMNITDKLRISL
jgi:exonuclease III